jgi:endonuclease YncB( thermonuclease family)
MRWLAMAALFGFATVAEASISTFVGNVEVRSGDTLVVGGTVVRLHGIDAFVVGQACWDSETAEMVDCGAESMRVLETIARKDKIVCPDARSLGPHDGIYRIGCFAGKNDVGQQMIKAGWALVRPDEVAPEQRAFLCGLEAEAKAQRAGAWRYSFTAPYVYRGKKAQSVRQLSCGNVPEGKT